MGRTAGVRVHSTLALILALVSFVLGLLPWVSAFVPQLLRWFTADGIWTMWMAGVGVGILALGRAAEARKRIRQHSADSAADRYAAHAATALAGSGVAMSLVGMILAFQSL